jgi:hypothetical protein
MERGYVFDFKYQEKHPKWHSGYKRYWLCLVDNCMEYAEDPGPEYWGCAWDCLDEFEEYLTK